MSIADAHGHSVQESGIPAASIIDALLSATNNFAQEPELFAAMDSADNWTVTVTQP